MMVGMVGICNAVCTLKWQEGQQAANLYSFYGNGGRDEEVS